MASIFGYFFVVWWTLLVMASSEARVGTFFNLVLWLELVMAIPLMRRRDVFHWNINSSYGDWMFFFTVPIQARPHLLVHHLLQEALVVHVSAVLVEKTVTSHHTLARYELEKAHAR